MDTGLAIILCGTLFLMCVVSGIHIREYLTDYKPSTSKIYNYIKKLVGADKR